MTSKLSQQQRILNLLVQVAEIDRNGWVGLPTILDLRIACYTKRISELREQGFVIECETTWVEGTRHSRYRLVVEPKQLELLNA